jgi:hypothetical protein
MGKSKSIAELEKQEDDFRQYLNKLQTELANKAASAKTDLQKTIDKFYGDNHYDDAKDLVSGENTHFEQSSEFSLANLKSIIDAISKTVFAGAAAPTGTDVNKEGVEKATKDLGAAVGKVTDLELYIAGKAFDVLSQTILSFGASNSLTFSSATKSEALGYGLQLFTVVAADSYKSTSFFNNQDINEYLYIYDVKFSLKQSKAEMTETLVESYENQIVAFTDMVNKQLEKLEQGTITPEQYQAVSDTYQSMIDRVQAQVDKLKSE